MQSSEYDGLLVVDKPPGITSRKVVDRARSWFPPGTAVGHTGTLDPLATGVLVVCVGTATRLAEYVQRMSKTYTTEILLGVRSDTDDLEGNVKASGFTGPPPDHARVASCVQQFVGVIDQAPPAFSAAKVTGRRAYDLARRGQSFTLEQRQVHILRIDILEFTYPSLRLEIECGKGTYIRSLARDLGERLGCGAAVKELRRTRVGTFYANDAISLTLDGDRARQSLLPMAAAVAELPRMSPSREDLLRLCQGQVIPLPSSLNLQGLNDSTRDVAVFASDGALAAIGRVEVQTATLCPHKVFQPIN